jgi:hypothetical protein
MMPRMEANGRGSSKAKGWNHQLGTTPKSINFGTMPKVPYNGICTGARIRAPWAMPKWECAMDLWQGVQGGRAASAV